MATNSHPLPPSGETRPRFQVTANFTAELLGRSLEFWCRQLGLGGSEIAFSPYNQVFQELLNPFSPSHAAVPGVNLFLIRLEDWARTSTPAEARDVVQKSARDLIDAFARFCRNARRPSVVFLTRPSALRNSPISHEVLEALTRDTKIALQAIPALVVTDHDDLSALYPTSVVEDAEAERLGHIPFAPEYWTALATFLIRKARVFVQPPFKVAVVDADNTLWTGVVGEVGVSGLEIGAGRRALQELLRERRKAGLLLALASKNRPEDVTAGLAHEGMILGAEDFVARKVNWRSKSENLRELAAELELGLDSFVFLDDNPLECAEVAAACPQVTVIQVPAGEQTLCSFVEHLWPLDLPPSTAADRDRTEQYQQQSARKRFQSETQSFGEFIEGLNLKVDFAALDAGQYERAAQLTQRTNQFNSTGIRRTAQELAARIGTGERNGFVVSVRDRFGDYGQVGLCIVQDTETETIAENFLLSCRVLSKGVEHQMLAALGRWAEERKKAWVVIPFQKTERNEPAEQFLQAVAAPYLEGDSYRIPAAIARSVTFQPAAVQPVEKPESRASSRVSGGQGICDFGWIARQLARPADIVAEVRKGSLRGRESLPRDFVPPRTGVEERLARIWEDVLGVMPVGADDAFLELGGQSIQATQILSRISADFGRRLPLGAILKNPRLSELAAEVIRKSELTDDELPLGSRPVLSPAQERMWFLDQFIPRRSAYNIVVARRVRGPFNVLALDRGLRAILERHEPLRTTLQQEGERRRLELSILTETPLRVTTAPNESAALAILEEDARTPFDLSMAPLLRCLVVTVREDDHFLLLNVHHIAADGWSINVLLRELSEEYNAAFRPGESRKALDRTYFDYATAIAQQSKAGAFDDDLAFWKERLAAAPRLLELPTDTPRPAVMTYEGEAVYHEVDSVTRRAIESLATSLQTTPFVILMAAFQAWLHRYSGQNDILVGTPVSGRDHAAFENIVGCFINTVVIRNAVLGETPFLDQVTAVRGTVLEALEHQNVPFERLIDEMGFERDLSHSPLFQVMLVFQNAPPGEFTAPGLRVEGAKVHNTGAKFDVVLEVTPGAEGYQLSWEYSSALFRKATARRMLGHFIQLLRSACASPETPIGRLPLMPAAELKQLRCEFSEPQSDFPQAPCLHHWFEQQAARTPNAPALTHENTTLTYAALNRRANRLAHHLIKCGVGPDTLVGLCLERSLDLVVSIVAILKAGGAYLPIDLSYPPERLAFMLEDARAPVLLTQSTLARALPQLPACTVLVDSAETELREESESNPSVDVRPDHLAYVIYTSGSTGKPKGCMITHRNVSRLMLATEAWYGFNSQDVWTLFHSSAFDFSVWEIWGALLYGGRLVVVPYLTSRAPEAFYELLSRERITVLNQTPSAFRQLIQIEESLGAKPLALRYVIFGGEALEMQSLRPWFDRHGDQCPRLVNMYGITETTVHVTYRPLSRDDVARGSVIGVPIPDLEFYILDSHLNPLPIGVPGEIYVGGGGVARGYLRRDDLTASRFIRHPFRPDSHERLYRTGDLARFLPGRDVEYLGRIDHQVKIRGFRIELGEIESVLCEHTQIREGVVIAREDQPGEKRLAAYLVAQAPAPSVAELREHLKKKLPDYMVPAAFVFLEKLPLTSNGKVDRRALPAPDTHRPQLGGNYVAPRDRIEEQLAGIWARVLRLERVGIHDNFFELGGDSILTIQIISLARQIGLGITLRALFSHQTIAQLAAVVDTKTIVQTVDQGAVTGDAPLSPIQEWFFNRRLADAHHYNQALLLQLKSRPNLAALQAALKQIQRHHDALRLRFVAAENGATNQQHFEGLTDALPFETVDVRQVADAELSKAIEAECSRLQSTLDLSQGPLWRIAYFDAGEERPSRLLIVIHHLAVDGVSWRIVVEDLDNGYRQALEGRTPNLPAKTTSFKAWAEHHHTPSFLKEITAETDHWMGSLTPSVALPVDHEQGANTESSTRSVTIRFSSEKTHDLLQKTPGAYNTQVNDLFLTALTRAWKTWTGGDELCLLLEGHGREDVFEEVDVSRTIGWFTTIHPARLRLPGPSLVDQIKAIKEQLRSIPRRGFGYLACRFLSSDPRLRSWDEPGIVFNYLGQFDQVVRDSSLFCLAAESTGAWHGPRQARAQLIEIDGRVVHDRLEFVWTYSTARHNQATIEKMAKAFQHELDVIIEHCLSPGAGGVTPSDYPLCGLNQAELDGLMARQSAIEDIYPLSPTQTLFYSAAAAGVNVLDQWSCHFNGPLEINTLRQAWDEVISRHPILRTSFHAIRSRMAVQIVREYLTVPWRIEDWRSQPPLDQESNWMRLVREDKARGMALDVPPLLRFALIRVGDEKYRFLWTIPALLMDGWSWPLVFQEISFAYRAMLRGEAASFEPVQPYRHYLAWLKHQNLASTESYWREELSGFGEPTPLLSEPPEFSNEGGRFQGCKLEIPGTLAGQLTALARSLQITSNTLFQSAWALTLSRLSNRPQVLFGAAFAGRPTDLPGSEAIVGPLVNNVPVTVKVSPTRTVRDFLLDHHQHLLDLSPHQYAPLEQIQSWSEVPWRHRLFESLIVVQNYLVDDSARTLGDRVTISDFQGPVHTNFPLLILVEPREEWSVNFIYDRQVLAGAAIERWQADFFQVLKRLSAQLDTTVSGILESLSEPQTARVQRRTRWQARPQNVVPPQTDVERRIATVWQDMFQIAEISVQENLFDMGAHSLLVIRLHQKLQETLSRDFPLVALFQYPTIQSLANHLSRPEKNGDDRAADIRNRAHRQREALARLRPHTK